MRTAILSRPVHKFLVAAVPLVALLPAGVDSRAGEPARNVEKTGIARDRLGRASALVQRLNDRVKAQRAALQEAESDLKLARELAEGLTKQAVEEWRATLQQEYEAQQRRLPNGGDQAAPGDPPFRIIPLVQ